MKFTQQFPKLDGEIVLKEINSHALLRAIDVAAYIWGRPVTSPFYVRVWHRTPGQATRIHACRVEIATQFTSTITRLMVEFKLDATKDYKPYERVTVTFEDLVTREAWNPIQLCCAGESYEAWGQSDAVLADMVRSRIDELVAKDVAATSGE